MLLVWSYNPGQNSLGHLCTKERDRHNSQDCPNKRHPHPSPPVQCWLEKIKSKLGLVQMIINIVWGEDFDFSEGNLISELILSLLSQSLFPGL